MQPRFNGIALISDDVRGLTSFYAGLLQATVEGDGAFAFIRGPGAVLSVFARAGMEAMVPSSTAPPNPAQQSGFGIPGLSSRWWSSRPPSSVTISSIAARRTDRSASDSSGIEIERKPAIW